MRLEPKVIDGPIVEPVSVDEVKLASRIAGSKEDLNLLLYIEAARRVFERETGRVIHQETLEFCPQSWLDPYAMTSPDVRFRSGVQYGTRLFNSIELPRATPLIEIESVLLKDSDGNVTTWDPSQYIADTRTTPGRLTLAYNCTWPQFTPDPVAPITIRYTAGQPDSPLCEADADIKLAVLLMVGEAYENRESFTIPDRAIQSMLATPIFTRIIRNMRVSHEYTEL